MRLASLSVLVAATLAVSTLASDSPFLAEGRAALQHRQPEKAAAALEEAVKRQPLNPVAHYFLGLAYGIQAMDAGVFRAAELASKSKRELERAIELDPDYLAARSGLIDFHLNAPGVMGGSYDEAAHQANEIKKRDPIAGHEAWAYIYRMQRKPDLSRNEYLEMVREQPRSAVAHYKLGTFYSGMFYVSTEKNYKAANEEFETAVKLDPHCMPAWYQIARLATVTRSNYARAEEALRKYFTYSPKEDEPSLARAHYLLGQIFEKQGRTKEARKSYETSFQLDPTQIDVGNAIRRLP